MSEAALESLVIKLIVASLLFVAVQKVTLVVVMLYARRKDRLDWAVAWNQISHIPDRLWWAALLAIPWLTEDGHIVAAFLVLLGTTLFVLATSAWLEVEVVRDRLWPLTRGWWARRRGRTGNE